jgi:hypothetical protein
MVNKRDSPFAIRWSSNVPDDDRAVSTPSAYSVILQNERNMPTLVFWFGTSITRTSCLPRLRSDQRMLNLHISIVDSESMQSLSRRLPISACLNAVNASVA